MKAKCAVRAGKLEIQPACYSLWLRTALTHHIPYRRRVWDGERKCWIIDVEYADVALELLGKVAKIEWPAESAKVDFDNGWRHAS